MIPVSDLLKWADEHAIGRSPAYPRGWVSGKDLISLGKEVEKEHPLIFYYTLQSNLAKGEQDDRI